MATLPSFARGTAAQVPKPALSAFRLGDDQAFDASDSEDDQSAASEQEITGSTAINTAPAPQTEQTEQKSTRSAKRRKNKKDRKEVGALQENLDTVLDNAFSAPQPEQPIATSLPEPTDDDLNMDTDHVNAGKKINKRTRQNMARVLARKQAGEKQQFHEQHTEQDQAAAAARRGMSLEDYRKTGGSKKLKNKERRMKKQKQRALKAEDEANRMEIG